MISSVFIVVLWTIVEYFVEYVVRFFIDQLQISQNEKQFQVNY